MIDTHSHLYDPVFDADRKECIARDREAGVEAVMLPAVDSSTHEALFDLCRHHPGYCYPMIGLHPTSVNEIPDWERELEIVEKLLKSPPAGRFYGIGEVGLDLHWSRDHEAAQTEALRRQIELSLAYGLPLAIHTRDAWPQMHAVLETFTGRGLRGVMHAFSGTFDDYQKIKRCGDFCFAIGGVITYKNSLLAETVTRMACTDIVLESDAPYLPPVPFRGKRNESGMIRFTAARIAQAMDTAESEVVLVTTANARRIFAI